MAVVCEQCGGTGWVVHDRDGMSGAERCSCFAIRRAASLLGTSGIPQAYRNASFDNLDGLIDNPIASAGLSRAASFAKRYAQNYPFLVVKPGLLIHGSHGAGKTHLLVAAAQMLVERFEVVFFDYQTLLNRIRAGWDREAGTSDREAYQRALDAEILVIDDLGARRSIDWVTDVVTDIVTHRYNHKKPILVSTNLPVAPAASDTLTPSGKERQGVTLNEVIGDRACSRLHEMCMFLDLRGMPDYRKRHQ